MRLKKKRVTELIVAGVLLAGGIGVYGVLSYSPIEKSVVVEAGCNELQISDFLKKDVEAAFKTVLSQQELSTLGDYEVTILYRDKEYVSKVEVKDTIAPSAAANHLECWIDEMPEAHEFVKDVVDATEVTYTFANELNTAEAGEYDVSVVLKDQGNNTTTIESKLTVKKDIEPPVFVGLSDKTVTIGSTVSYRTDVSVKDNKDENLTFTVDSSAVNMEKAGQYTVTYKAEDLSGNQTTKTITVTVKEKEKSSYTVSDVQAKAKSVVNKIIRNDMTQRQKCRKIFDWVKSHVSYVNSSEKSSWTNAAMQAFNKGKGDCYNFWAVTKALLDAAGVENMDLKATKHTHYWNFVKVEEGWYHLDTTPRKDKPDLFLRTDEWIDAYSLKHSNCFSYSKEGKPASATK